MSPELRADLKAEIRRLRNAGFDIAGVGYMPVGETDMEVRKLDGEPWGVIRNYRESTYSVRDGK